MAWMCEFLSMEKPLITQTQPLIVEVCSAGISTLPDRLSDKLNALRGKYPIKKMEGWSDIANWLVQQGKTAFFPPGHIREERSGLSGGLGTRCGSAVRQRTHGCCLQTVKDGLMVLITEIIPLYFLSKLHT